LTIFLKKDERPELEIRDALWTLLDTALLNGGYHINEGKTFNNRMMRAMKMNLGVDSFELMPEIEPKIDEEIFPDMDEDAAGINVEDFDEFKEEMKANPDLAQFVDEL